MKIKTLVHYLQQQPNYVRISGWGRLIALTGSSQLLIQAIGFISGLLVIRLLPPEEYALYILANTMLGSMSILADGGIASGVTAQGGKVWQDKEKLGAVLATGMDLRKKFAIGSLLIASPALVLLLRHHNASWLMTALILLSLLPAFFSALSGKILQIPLKLKQDIGPLQKNEVGVNAGRLAMLTITLFVFPLAFVAVLASGLPQIWANIRLRKISSAYADWRQVPVPEVRKEILSLVKRMLPGAVYYCISGQLSIWIISVFGTTISVASLGALGRLTMVLTLFGLLFQTLIVPRFARMPAKRELLLKKSFLIQGGLLALNCSVIFFTWFFSDEILWVLGREYAHLEEELVLQVVGGCIASMSALSFLLFTSRGYAINPVVSIPLNIVSIAVGAILFDLSSLEGVLVYNIFVSAIQFCMNFMYGGIKIWRLKEAVSGKEWV